MTYRLIGLMSFVLLLCMATFALLTRRYENEIMTELAKTVTAVGQQTFRSLESGSLLWTGTGGSSLESLPDGDKVEVKVQVVPGTPEPTEQTVRKFQFRGEGDDQDLVIIETLTESGDGSPSTIFQTRDTHVIRIDGIHAETDAARGILLRIPALHGDAHDSQAFTTTFDFHAEHSGMPAGMGFTDIVLPVSTADYESLFHSMQTRWLMMFAGVFAVGLILSSGLAARFTRPVRKLDAGLRRLSEGDLEVEVEVHGKDEIARLGAAFNELTARLRAGREREREVTRREKLSALGSLAAGVAHDVRNPLHSIGLTLQHLQETARPVDQKRSEEFDRSVHIIREEIGRLDRLVQNFLRFTRTGEGERGELAAGKLLLETSHLIGKEAEWRNIQVKVEVQEPLPEIPADIEAIRSSILNLALNSFAAMPEGGVLTLSTREVEGGLEIAVSDTGAGISDQELEKVFDFGYSTREEGNGLGLAMVHQCIVDNHGGRIDLASQEGEGTTFRLFFPIQADA